MAQHDCSFSSTALLVCVILFITIHLWHVVPDRRRVIEHAGLLSRHRVRTTPEIQTVSDAISLPYKFIRIYEICSASIPRHLATDGHNPMLTM